MVEVGLVEEVKEVVAMVVVATAAETVALVAAERIVTNRPQKADCDPQPRRCPCT